MCGYYNSIAEIGNMLCTNVQFKMMINIFQLIFLSDMKFKLMV